MQHLGERREMVSTVGAVGIPTLVGTVETVGPMGSTGMIGWLPVKL